MESARWQGRVALWRRPVPNRQHPQRREKIVAHYQYLALMGLCLLLTLPLEFVFTARIYLRLRSLLVAVLPVVVVFSIWDVIGIARHHWSYNPRFVTGVQLPLHLPLEELVFFVVIPICGLLTYEAVGTVLRRRDEHRASRARSEGRTRA